MNPIDLSIIVPALNEEKTIGLVVDELLSLPLSTQIIVVNDGSTDNTASILESYGQKIDVITNAKPGGKGNAIRKAVGLVKGKAVIVQDADLEYDPKQIPKLVEPILSGKETVVYGTRFSNGLIPGMALPNKIVNVLLALSVRILYGAKLTDEATCYKAFRSDLLINMDLECERFEFCPEVTAKALRMGERIAELPITYIPRSKSEGKKIRWTDAPEAFLTLAKYRKWKKKPSPESVSAEPRATLR